MRSLLLDVDEFRRVMFGAWCHPAVDRWLDDHRTGKPDTQADIRGWWFLKLPFDKAIHGQLLAAIGTKAKTRQKKKKKKKKKKRSGSKRK